MSVQHDQTPHRIADGMGHYLSSSQGDVHGIAELPEDF